MDNLFNPFYASDDIINSNCYVSYDYDELKKEIQRLKTKELESDSMIKKLTMDIQHLKNKEIENNRGCQVKELENLKKIVNNMFNSNCYVSYDYEEIRSRNYNLNKEFKKLFRLFSRRL